MTCPFARPIPRNRNPEFIQQLTKSLLATTPLAGPALRPTKYGLIMDAIMGGIQPSSTAPILQPPTLLNPYLRPTAQSGPTTSTGEHSLYLVMIVILPNVIDTIMREAYTTSCPRPTASTASTASTAPTCNLFLRPFLLPHLPTSVLPNIRPMSAPILRPSAFPDAPLPPWSITPTAARIIYLLPTPAHSRQRMPSNQIRFQHF